MERSITELFDTFIKQYSDEESASNAFNEYLEATPEVKEEYKEWCDSMGYTLKKGFSGYYHDYHEREDIWESIFPNREEYDEYDFRKD